MIRTLAVTAWQDDWTLISYGLVLCNCANHASPLIRSLPMARRVPNLGTKDMNVT